MRYAETKPTHTFICIHITIHTYIHTYLLTSTNHLTYPSLKTPRRKFPSHRPIHNPLPSQSVHSHFFLLNKYINIQSTSHASSCIPGKQLFTSSTLKQTMMKAQETNDESFTVTSEFCVLFLSLRWGWVMCF